MSKQCNVCGYTCEDTDTNCPICGSPLPQNISANQPQYQQAPQQNQPQYQQAPQQNQPQYQQAPSKKKSHKTLYIVLGVVGGILVIVIILVIILCSFLRHHLISSYNFNPSSYNYQRYETNNHEYYYPDYEGADLNSEAYTSTSTEATTEATTEEATEEAASSLKLASITESEFIIYGQTAQAEDDTDVVSIPLDINNSYLLSDSGSCLVTPLATEGSAYELNSESAYIQLYTGRFMNVGTAIELFILTYGIDSTNAIWIEQTGDQITPYYYSTVTAPTFTADQTQLVLGWYQTDAGWIRFTPTELYDALMNNTYPDCDSFLIYKATANSDHLIETITIDYGSADALPVNE